MTRNQIAYRELLETERSNRARETETNRSNLADENEYRRSNIARETETNRSNIARESETNRTNVANESLRDAELQQRKKYEKQRNLLEAVKIGTNFIGNFIP